MFSERLLRLAHHVLLATIVVGSTLVLSAQTVVDPRYVEFTPSDDHDALASDGTPRVQSYALTIYLSGSSTPYDMMNLGKPTPVAGLIRVDFLPLLHTTPTAGLTFEARVTAIGPGGSTPSDPSNGFTFPSCAPSIAPTSLSAAAGASSGSVTVTAATGCTWSATSNASWITLSGATSGNGNGSVPYSIAANATTSTRVGTLTIAGQTFTVTQAGLTCSYTLGAAGQSIVAGAATGSTTVTTPGGCAWTAVSNNTSWLTVTSGASGSGSGSVGFSATANPNASQRVGTLTVGGQTFTVTQAAATCSYAISPTGQSIIAGAATGSTTVTTPGGCAWTAVSNNTSWLTVTSGASGTGGGSVGFSATANPNASQRVGTLTIAGQTFTVTQAAATCSYAISPTGTSVLAAGGTGTTTMTAPGGCAWTAVSNNTSWLTVTSGASGSGGGTIGYSATANPNAAQRVGTIAIGGQTFTLTQAAAGCTFAIAPTGQSVTAAGTTGSTTVTTAGGCQWTAVSNASWITVTSGASGTGSGPVAFSIASNPNGTSRTGTLTVAAQTYTVTQAAAACTYAISPASQSVVAAGANGSTTVTATPGCAWTAASNVTWITVTAGASGTGNGSAGYSVTQNPTTAQRTGTLTIAGRTLTVTQAANTCTYTLAPGSRTLTHAAASGTIGVTAGGSCAWSPTTTVSWITVSGSATGSGQANYSVPVNATGSARTGTISIASQVFTIIQDAGPTPAAPTGLRIIPTGGGNP